VEVKRNARVLQAADALAEVVTERSGFLLLGGEVESDGGEA